MSFSQGISGLAASAAQLDAIGNNVANSATVGYKAGSVSFKDVFAGSKIGLGVAVASVSQNFAAGAVRLTNRPLDLAVTDGNGFFRLTDPGSGEVSYTRNGEFTVDKGGYVVSTTGKRLTGYAVNANGTLAGGTPAALRFPTADMAPQATSSVDAQFNLDARNALPTAGAFDPQDSNTYNYSNALTVFDSLGNPHELGLFFVKTSANNWDVYGTMDGTAIAGSTPLVFDPNGTLDATVPGNGTVSFAGVVVTNGANNLTIDVDLAGSTQFGNSSAVKQLSQDGYTSGTLTSYAIGPDGVITGNYSNEQKLALGQVVLSSFANPNGLVSLGNNEWGATAASGQALTGEPGSASLGTLTSGALESSNVDLTSELVDLITAQRSYQANAQTLKTQDQVMQTLVNLR